jgi:CheY-like chemotaxis protein
LQRRKQLLYVEDSAAAQHIMRRFLTVEGYDLTICPSPQEAAKLLQARKFDLVITDFLFGSGDALEFIAGLRRNFTPEQLPIIAVSSSMDAALQTKLHRAGVNDCVAKPLKVDRLRQTVARMLAEPYVRKPEGGVSGVMCLQWFEGGQFHEYSPELGLRVSASSRNESSEKMRAAILDALARGGTAGCTSGERIITHYVSNSGPPAAS